MTSKKIIRAVAYVRVSRYDQEPGLQEDEVAEFASRRGWHLLDVYKDHGVSGARDRRPQLDRLMHDAKRRRFDTLIVWRTDRLFRSSKHMLVTLDELASLGIDFVSTREPFDTSTPSGKLLFQIVAAMAEFERSLIVERTKAGLAAAVRRGAKLGRPRLAMDIARAAELRARGMSERQIAKAMNVSRARLQRSMRQPGRG